MPAGSVFFYQPTVFSDGVAKLKVFFISHLCPLTYLEVFMSATPHDGWGEVGDSARFPFIMGSPKSIA